MIIQTCVAFRYALPLRWPLPIGKQTLVERQGLIIGLGDDQGHFGYGEAAPLPGLHAEDLSQVQRQYRQLRPRLLRQKLPADLALLQGGFDRWLGRYGLCPTLRYGIEMAVLNVLACARGSTLAGLLTRRYVKRLPINGLWTGDRATNQLDALAAAGYTTIKFKVGRQPLAAEIDTVRTARALLGEHVRLRLDANRAWDLPTAVAFARQVAACGIEYIEEPLAEPGLIPEFAAQTGMAVALDESIDRFSTLPRGVTALVLKPAVLGGFEKTQNWIRLARTRRLKTVISSAFESGVGLAALANFAAASGSAGLPAGLDTFRWLREDLPKIRFAAAGARVDVDRVYHHARRLCPRSLKALDVPSRVTLRNVR